MEFQFETARLDFKEKIGQDLGVEKVDGVPLFNSLYSKYVGTETEKKTAADQTLRDLIKEELNNSNQSCSRDTITNILDIITISVAVAKQGLCSPSIPFIILGDVLDCFTLDACDVVFQFIEERVAIWKSVVFYTAGKNYLLRMCNDLLRRLSQSKNTVFCGRIQLFLARLFPLSEKSALNLVSQFNLENVTIFNKDPANSTLQLSSEEAKDGEKMEIDTSQTQHSDEAVSKGSEIVDYKLYENIWSLQDMFRYPVQCYTKELWEKFTADASAVFRIFLSYKLEDVGHSRTTAQTHNNMRVYFSKFLTSEKLTNLQLSDGLFRRQMLTQFLILFRYLGATVKFKGSSLVLTDAMKSWISETEPKIYELLEETPPNGKTFARYIKHLMEREEYWITWKNDGCPSFMKMSKPSPEEDEGPSSKKRKLEDDKLLISEEFISGKNLGMGSAELTRLWKLSPDNLAACQSSSREFIPSLQDYFIECVEQNDPKNAIEDQYNLTAVEAIDLLNPIDKSRLTMKLTLLRRFTADQRFPSVQQLVDFIMELSPQTRTVFKSVNKTNFQWKALRLLSHRSQLFFTSQPTTMQFKTVPDYLTSVISKLAKDFPTPPPDENGVSDQIDADEENGEMKETPESEEMKEVEGDDVLEGEDNNGDDEEIGEDDSNILDDPQNDTASNNDSDLLTNDDVTTYATKIGSDWKKLAPHLDLKPKDIKEIEEDSDDAVLQARQTLVTWQDMVSKEATLSSLSQALKAAGLESTVRD